jgi:hypothetical protein
LLFLRPISFQNTIIMEDQATEKNVNRSKKLRTSVRSYFSRLINTLRDELGKEDCNLVDCQGKLCTLEDKLEELRALDKIIVDNLLDQDSNTNDFDEELEKSSEYIEKFNQVRVSVQNRLDKARTKSNFDDVSVGPMSRTSNDPSKKKFRLPHIEFKKFSGDLKDWLTFWGQFQRIDVTRQ